MTWTIRISDLARKQLKKMDKQTAVRIMDFLQNRLTNHDDPRTIGESLKGARFGDFWKYRVGDYRIICDIEDQELTILVLQIGNRREVYR